MRKSNQTKFRSLNADETQHIIDCYAALLGSENAMFRDECFASRKKGHAQKGSQGKDTRSRI